VSQCVIWNVVALECPLVAGSRGRIRRTTNFSAVQFHGENCTFRVFTDVFVCSVISRRVKTTRTFEQQRAALSQCWTAVNGLPPLRQPTTLDRLRTVSTVCSTRRGFVIVECSLYRRIGFYKIFSNTKFVYAPLLAQHGLSRTQRGRIQLETEPIYSYSLDIVRTSCTRDYLYIHYGRVGEFFGHTA